MLINVHVRGGARSICSFHSHTQKAVKIRDSFTAQPVRFTRLSPFAHSPLHSSPQAHPQSHSSVLKKSAAQFFPFFKKVDKSENTHRLSEHAEWSRSLMALHLQVGEEENDSDITPRMLPKRSFLAGKWKRGELQKRVQWRLFHRTWIANKFAFKKHLGFNQIHSNARLPFKPMTVPDNELQTFMHFFFFSKMGITFHNTCIRESSWNGYKQTSK